MRLRHELTRRADGTVALGGEATTIHAGEYVVLAGPDESGKSTLLGLVAKESTSILREILGQGVHVARWPNDAPLYAAQAREPDLTVRSYLVQHVRRHGGTPAVDLVERRASELGLVPHPDQPVRMLSGRL